MIALVEKVMRRGEACPVPASAERALLQRAGLDVSERDGSTVPRPTTRLHSDRLTRGLGQVFSDELAEDLVLGSHAEARVLEALVAPGTSGMGVLPQAWLDGLALAHGKKSTGERRVDFLLEDGASGGWTVLEVDGSQHAQALRVDEARDKLLAEFGIPVHRVDTDALASAHLPSTSRDWQVIDPSGVDPLIHGPAAIDALTVAALEAWRHGMVRGRDWCFELHDDTGLALLGLPALLQLITAMDELWGGREAPSTVTIHGEVPRTWRLLYGVWETSDEHLTDVDARLHLEPLHSPLHRLPDGDATPAIVVRSARLPVSLLNTQSEGLGTRPDDVDDATIARSTRVVLREVFGLADYLPGQLEAITHAVRGRDCAVLLPTGAGKSLIYQMAGLVRPGRTLVVDPIISLMEDQVRSLKELGIDRVVAISSMTRATGAMPAAQEAVSSGDALFILIAPERLQQQSFRDALARVSKSRGINLVAVDEAHCVSEWGHDFRPSYLDLGRVVRRLCEGIQQDAPSLLALTGTASQAVLRDVLQELDIARDSDTVIKPASFDRPELHYAVVRGKPADTQSALMAAVASMPSRFGADSDRFFEPRGEETFSGLVFCPHVNGDFGTERVAERLATVTKSTVLTYAGTAPKDFQEGDWEVQKRLNAQRFLDNEVSLMVSTKAFGMGIDKRNIRYVVHLGIPGSIESFYQEVGRAGRDRRRAEAVLVFTEESEEATRRKLDLDADVDEARQAASEVARAHSDDIDRQLFFHFGTFQGRKDEVALVRALIKELGELGEERTSSIPHVDKARELGLHRLKVLGVVRDYRVDWGGDKYDVDLAAVRGQDVVEALLAFVDRSQSGRAASMRAMLAPKVAEPLPGLLDTCVEQLVEFVYDTIEKSRRRSLREMWLAARESQDESEMRARILAYLSDGDLSPMLIMLAERPEFSFTPWLDLIEEERDSEALSDLRGASARLLTSYPDNPGLLWVRSASELLDSRGDLQEASSSLQQAIRSAPAYSVSGAELESALERTLALLLRQGLRDEAGVLVASTVGRTSWAPDLTMLDGSSVGDVLRLHATMARFGSVLDTLDDLGVVL